MMVSLKEGGNKMFTKVFWYSTVERAVKTFAQALLAVLLSSGAFDLFHANYGDIFSVALTATVISVLTSVVSAAATNGTPSLAVTETTPTVESGVV
jgi:hypothetical protein